MGLDAAVAQFISDTLPKCVHKTKALYTASPRRIDSYDLGQLAFAKPASCLTADDFAAFFVTMIQKRLAAQNENNIDVDLLFYLDNSKHVTKEKTACQEKRRTDSEKKEYVFHEPGRPVIPRDGRALETNWGRLCASNRREICTFMSEILIERLALGVGNTMTIVGVFSPYDVPVAVVGSAPGLRIPLETMRMDHGEGDFVPMLFGLRTRFLLAEVRQTYSEDQDTHSPPRSPAPRKQSRDEEKEDGEIELRADYGSSDDEDDEDAQSDMTLELKARSTEKASCEVVRAIANAHTKEVPITVIINDKDSDRIAITLLGAGHIMRKNYVDVFFATSDRKTEMRVDPDQYEALTEQERQLIHTAKDGAHFIKESEQCVISMDTLYYDAREHFGHKGILSLVFVMFLGGCDLVENPLPGVGARFLLDEFYQARKTLKPFVYIKGSNHTFSPDCLHDHPAFHDPAYVSRFEFQCNLAQVERFIMVCYLRKIPAKNKEKPSLEEALRMTYGEFERLFNRGSPRYRMPTHDELRATIGRIMYAMNYYGLYGLVPEVKMPALADMHPFWEEKRKARTADLRRDGSGYRKEYHGGVKTTYTDSRKKTRQ
jgi:hypothetical protein